MGIQQQVLKISFFSFLVFSATSSYHGTIGFIFSNLGMPRVGPASLFLRYISYTISIILFPAITINLKVQFRIAAVLYAMNYLLAIAASTSADTIMIYCVMLSGNFIDGFASGIMGIAKGRYLHLLCEVFSINKNRGHILGIHQFIHCCSFVGGALITFFCIGFSDNTTYFSSLFIFGIISFLYCLYSIDSIEDIGNAQLTKLKQDSKAQTSRIEAINTVLDEKKVNPKGQQQNGWSSIKKMFSYIPQIYYLFPFLITYGLSVGIKMSLMIHLVPDSFMGQEKNRIAGVCQILIGAGSVFGGYLASFLTDLIGTVLTTRISLLIFTLCEVYLFSFGVEMVSTAYLIAFMWGLSSHAFMGLYSVICSRHLGGGKEVLSLVRLIYTVALLLFHLTMTYMSNEVTFGTLSVLRGSSLLAFLLIGRLPQPKYLSSHQKEQ